MPIFTLSVAAILTLTYALATPPGTPPTPREEAQFRKQFAKDTALSLLRNASLQGPRNQTPRNIVEAIDFAIEFLKTTEVTVGHAPGCGDLLNTPTFNAWASLEPQPQIRLCPAFFEHASSFELGRLTLQKGLELMTQKEPFFSRSATLWARVSWPRGFEAELDAACGNHILETEIYLLNHLSPRPPRPEISFCHKPNVSTDARNWGAPPLIALLYERDLPTPNAQVVERDGMILFVDHSEEIPRFRFEGAFDPNARNMPSVMRSTALCEAVRIGRRNWVLLLLREGADPNLGDRFGVTPLMLAARNGDTATVELLISQGAAKNQRDSSGMLAREHAFAEGHTALARTLH